MPDLLVVLGHSIKKLRRELALSQEQLAERCGFDRTYISMLERGARNPTLLNLLRLANGLEVPISKLTEVLDGTESDK